MQARVHADRPSGGKERTSKRRGLRVSSCAAARERVLLSCAETAQAAAQREGQLAVTETQQLGKIGNSSSTHRNWERTGVSALSPPSSRTDHAGHPPGPRPKDTTRPPQRTGCTAAPGRPAPTGPEARAMEPPGPAGDPSVRTERPSRTHGCPGVLSVLGAMLLGWAGATPGLVDGAGAPQAAATPGRALLGDWELQADPRKAEGDRATSWSTPSPGPHPASIPIPEGRTVCPRAGDI